MATRSERQPELPGYLSLEGGILHFDVPRFLREAGIPDTPENRESVSAIAAQVARDYWPGKSVEVRDGQGHVIRRDP